MPIAMTDEARGSRRVPLVLMFLGVYLLLAIAWQDIGLLQFDDATYLDSGRYVRPSMFLNGLTTMPLYALWFRLLTFVCPDPLWRHFLSWGILTGVAALLPVIFEVPLAWLYAGVLFGISYFQIGPYVSLFAAVFFVAGVCVVLWRRVSLAGAAAVACAACFLGAYSRPEYQYGVFFSAIAVLIAVLADRRKTQIPFGNDKQRGGGTLTAVGAAILLAGAMLYVAKHSDSGRSGVAFAQHYNLKAAAKGLIPHTNEWDDSYAYDVFGLKAVNGTAPTIGAFFHANPKLFLAFVRSNVLSPMTLLLVGGLAVLIWWAWRSEENRALRPASLFIFLISLPTLVSMSLVYPDKHYLSIVFPALLLFGLQLVPVERVVRIDRQRWIPAALLLMTIGVSLRKSMVVDRLMTQPKAGLAGIMCLRELDRQAVRGNVVGFDSTHTAGVFLRSQRRFVHAEDFSDWDGADRWIVGTRPDWIVASPGFAARYGVTEEQFLKVMWQMGYVPHPCGGEWPVVVYTAPGR